jgi:hypothetical protein
MSQFINIARNGLYECRFTVTSQSTNTVNESKYIATANFPSFIPKFTVVFDIKSSKNKWWMCGTETGHWYGQSE